MNPLVQHLLVTTTARFDPRGNPTPATQYSYYIGKHGPFVDSFATGTDTPENVKAAIQKRIDNLEQIGALGQEY